MGEIADQLCSDAIKHNIEFKINTPKNSGDYIWVMRDGKEIKVCDMTELHISNVIHLLKRNNSSYSNRWINILTQELNRRK